MGKLKLVCFDLDDNLIREIHSVMLPCILNGKEKEHSLIQEQEEKGVIDYISADYLRAELLVGLEECKIARFFLEIAKPLKNIKNVVEALHEQGIKCIAVGDYSKDIPVFEYCGKSIALSSLHNVRKCAVYAVGTDDLTDIIKYILPA